MSANKTKSTRRTFFLHGGAVLGAGVASAAGAAGVTASGTSTLSAEEQLRQLQDREAIRQLHVSFTSLIEKQQYEAAADLFDEQAELQLSGVSASGKSAIREVFADQYRQQTCAAIHNAYRPNGSQRDDALDFAPDRQRATATYHVDVQVSAPLPVDCTAAQMARMQGQVADRWWEAGRFEAAYVKTVRGAWKMASLNYRRV
jgi:hypothetical protein